MNEFIVWDKKDKTFVSKEDASFIESGSYSSIITDIIDKNTDRYQLFKGIGKTDINNEMIYADCSIVEFDLKQNHPLEIYSKECGIFKYSNETLSYYIELLNGNTLGFGRWENVKNIKIIDTIQENKLGLMS